MIPIMEWHGLVTIARGNCSSMKTEIAGNIMSLVSGLEDILAAVAKELNATSTA